MTLAEFVKENRISMTFEGVAFNPNCPDFRGYHWRVSLTRRVGKNQRRYMTTPFSTGLGVHNPEPELMTVLECLHADSYMSDAQFEAWAEELGYDTDSRAAYATYKAIERQTLKLRRFLGDTFEAFLACID